MYRFILIALICIISFFICIINYQSVNSVDLSVLLCLAINLFFVVLILGCWQYVNSFYFLYIDDFILFYSGNKFILFNVHV